MNLLEADFLVDAAANVNIYPRFLLNGYFCPDDFIANTKCVFSARGNSKI